MEKHKNELTGSFALNALGETEREALLRQAETSEQVRDEMDAMQETAALLGLSAEPIAPPARVKANIMAAIRNTAQLPPVETRRGNPAPGEPEAADPRAADGSAPLESTEPAPAPRGASSAAPKTSQRFFALAASVLLVAAGVLGGVVFNQNAQQQKLEDQLTALNTKQAELTRILTAGDVQLQIPDIGRRGHRHPGILGRRGHDGGDHRRNANPAQ